MAFVLPPRTRRGRATIRGEFAVLWAGPHGNWPSQTQDLSRSDLAFSAPVLAGWLELRRIA